MAYNGNARSSSTWWARQSLAYPDNRRTLRYEVQTWRLGDLTAVALEGEVCADWGPMVRALARTRHAMAIAYANEVPGYIPTAQAFLEGGYEPTVALASADSEELILKAMRKLLQAEGKK